MSELVRFRRMFEHNAWANGVVLDGLRPGPAPANAGSWIAHIVGSERLWLARIRHEPSEMPVWPELDFDICAEELVAIEGEWMQCLATLDEEGLEEGVGYRNSKGEFWTSTVGDILSHALLHSHYHRGQIASAVREAGGTPVYTDFIHAVRTGLIE